MRRLHLDNPVRWRSYIWPKSAYCPEANTPEYREAALKDPAHSHSRCVWKCDNNQVDRQSVIISFADGTVTAVGESSLLGKYVTVLHANNYTTLYAHCSRIMASSGQQVRMGDPIAEVGQTGQATGPHLHFELHLDTVYLNPIYYVAA